jgi:hypothetical protein
MNAKQKKLKKMVNRKIKSKRKKVKEKKNK